MGSAGRDREGYAREMARPCGPHRRGDHTTAHHRLGRRDAPAELGARSEASNSIPRDQFTNRFSQDVIRDRVHRFLISGGLAQIGW